MLRALGNEGKADVYRDTCLRQILTLTGQSDVRRHHCSPSWNKKRRVVVKVEWHPDDFCPRVGFIVTNLSRPAERVRPDKPKCSAAIASPWPNKAHENLRWQRPSGGI